jgi:hypothetical protein
MDYEKFKEVFIEAKKKYKARCIASVLCVPIWVAGTHLGEVVEGVGGDWFSIGDAWGCIILLCIAVFYANRGHNADMQLKRAIRLQRDKYKHKITIYIEKVFYDHKEIKDPKEVARLVKRHISHLGNVRVGYET